MWKDMNDYVNDNDMFGNCENCDDRTSNHKLKEFDGICEECYYEDKE